MAGKGTGGILHSKILAKPLIAHEGKGVGTLCQNCMHKLTHSRVNNSESLGRRQSVRLFYSNEGTS